MAKIILGAILIFSLIIRIWSIENVPPGLYWDEMDVGYQAYSILKTGRDYFGQSNLLVVHSFADFRAPLLIYATIPFIAVFGLNPISVRLPAVIFGVLSVLLIYLLTKTLFKDNKTALIAAALTSLAPWNIQYSRMAFEATLMLSLALAGVICFLKGLNRPKLFLASAFFFGLSLFAYNTAKFFVPLIILAMSLIYLRKSNMKIITFISAILFTLFILLSFYGTFFLGGGQRFSQISIFDDSRISKEVDVLRHNSGVAYTGNHQLGIPVRPMDKVIYNKLTYIADIVMRNYLQVFSTEFLFLKGDPNLRHSTSVTGEFYPVEALTILLGIVVLILGISKREKSSIFLVIWIIIAPLASTITKEGGSHATRLFFVFPALTIASALGAGYILKLSTKKNLFLPAIIISLGLIWCVIFFFNFYFGIYNTINGKQFQYGFRQAVETAIAREKDFEFVVIDDRDDSALMDYIFYTQMDPALFQSQIKTLGTTLLDYDADRIGNIIMMKPGDRLWQNIFKGDMLYNHYLAIISADQMNEQDINKLPDKFNKSQILIDVIKYKSGEPAFYVIDSQLPKKRRC